MSDEDIINEVRDKIRRKQEITQDLIKVWKLYLQIENEPYKQNIDKTFVNLCRLINNLYMHIEGLTIMNFGLKNQIDLLKDILLQIPMVKNNPDVQKDVEKLFSGYSNNVDNLMKSFNQNYGIKNLK
jgi:hypothetical protein